MNKLIALLGLLATLVSATTTASVLYDEEPEESVDCFYEANANNPLCKK